jgi:hypothetical protein
MTLPTKIALWLFAIALIWIGAASGQVGTKPEPTPTNCWDQYQTEYEAILNCEKHDDN